MNMLTLLSLFLLGIPPAEETLLAGAERGKGGLALTIRLLPDRVTITITNRSTKAVVFSRRADYLVCFHQSAAGTKTPLTWDGSNADMKLLTPEDLVTLKPGASHQMKRAFWIDSQHKIDRRRLLNAKGVLYAVAHAVNVRAMEDRYRQAYKSKPFLRRAATSNRLKVPVTGPRT